MASSAQCRGVLFLQANGRAPGRLVMAGSGRSGPSAYIHSHTLTPAGPETLNQKSSGRSAWPWPLDAYGRPLVLTWNGLPTLEGPASASGRHGCGRPASSSDESRWRAG